MKPLLEQLREALETSGRSRYSIAKRIPLSESTLSRFMSHERGLSLAAAERLAEHLGFAVVLKRIKRRK